MNSITLLSAQNPGAGVLRKNTTINIDTPQDHEGRKLYRQLYYLHFTVDPACEGIAIDIKTSILQGYFHDYTLHLTENNQNFQASPWQAISEGDGNLTDLVKVHLTHPWQLQSVSTIDKRGVEVLRLDGDAVSGEATIKGNSNISFIGEFTGQDFALRKVTAFPASSSTKKVKEKTQQASSKDSADKATDKKTSVATHGIKTISLKSLPTGPRILLGEMGLSPTLDDNLLNIWQQPGEQTELPVYFFKDEWQAAFNEIQKACDRYFTSLLESGTPPSEHLYLPIIFESDTPTRLQLTEFKLDYGLLRHHLDNIENKHTLKFAGTTIENQQLPLSLPTNSIIKHATLSLNNSLKNGFGLTLTDKSTLANILHQHTGVDMANGLTVANRVDNPEAQQVDCFVLAVMPFTDEIKATLQIVQDVNNGPYGSVLAQTQINLKQPHLRQWAVAKFSTPTLLDRGVYWLSLTIQQGQLVWLGETGDGMVHIQQNDKVDKIVNTLRLLNLSGLSSPKSGAIVDVALQVAETPAPLLKQDNSGLTFDLKDGLNVHYGTGRPAPVLVNLASGRKGNLTIKAIEVIYDLETS